MVDLPTIDVGSALKRVPKRVTNRKKGYNRASVFVWSTDNALINYAILYIEKV